MFNQELFDKHKARYESEIAHLRDDMSRCSRELQVLISLERKGHLKDDSTAISDMRANMRQIDKRLGDWYDRLDLIYMIRDLTTTEEDQ